MDMMDKIIVNLTSAAARRVLGIRKDGELVATFNIDLDEKYAERLGSIITESTRGAVTEKHCYEASGLMTDGRFRGKGLGTALIDAVTERAK